MLETSRTGSVVKVKFTEPLSIYTVASVKPPLLAALAGATELELDLSLVEEMDTAGYQLLLLVKRESDRRGVRFSIKGHSPATHTIFEVYQALGALNVAMN